MKLFREGNTNFLADKEIILEMWIKLENTTMCIEFYRLKI